MQVYFQTFNSYLSLMFQDAELESRPEEESSIRMRADISGRCR